MKYILSLALLYGFLIISCNPKNDRLPILGRKEIKNVTFEGQIKADTVYHTIRDFSFTDQDGNEVTQDTFKDKIYVADFFFTTCPTICPIMTDNLVWLQDKIKNMPDVMFLSHSVTPDIDSVSVLKKYALEKGVLDSKWNLVTGNKKDIYYIARKSYLAVETGKPEELYDMVHTENFVLIDKKGRIRGFYDGTNLDKPTDDGTKNVTQLLEDIKWLSEIEK